MSVGRVDEHKGSSMLAAFFRTYKERHPGPLKLAMVGPVAAIIAPHDDIVLTGAVPEADKWDIVRDAMVARSPRRPWSRSRWSSWKRGSSRSP